MPCFPKIIKSNETIHSQNPSQTKYRLCINTGVLLLSSSCSENTEEISNPYVILLFTDDMGFGDLRCFDHPMISVPNLDVVMYRYHVQDPLWFKKSVSFVIGPNTDDRSAETDMITTSFFYFDKPDKSLHGIQGIGIRTSN